MMFVDVDQWDFAFTAFALRVRTARCEAAARRHDQTQVDRDDGPDRPGVRDDVAARRQATIVELVASLQAVSRHIAVLEQAGLVTRSRDAQRRPVHLDPGTSPSTIQRYQRERQVTFLLNGKPGANEGAIGDAVVSVLDDEVKQLPKGFSARPQGQTKIMKEVALSFVLGLLASMLFMYLILAAQFESWLYPIIILISLPLTVPFALLSLLLFHQGLNLMSALGVLVLFGVVKKNSILQIDHTNHLRKLGRPRLEAILEGNRDRLRPILMTTIAFVAGMIPLALSRGVGSGNNRNIAGIVIGGQSFSLLLTLLAVPVAYSYFDDLRVFLGRVFTSKKPRDRGEKELTELLGDQETAEAVAPPAE